MSQIESSVNDQLRFANLVRGLDKLDHEALLKITIELARLAFVTQPAAMRWAAMEAAKNLGNSYGSAQGIK